MKKLLLCTLALTALGVSADVSPTPAVKRPRIPARETNAYKRRYGGDLIQPGTMQGRFMFFDEARRTNETAQVVKVMRTLFRIDAVTATPSEKVQVANAEKLVFGAQANAGVFVVDCDGLPVLLTAPQSRFAFVNVKPLKSDGPAEDVLAARIRKELWRAFAFICGGGTSETPGCVMNPVFSLSDLDRLGTEMISPDGGRAMRTTTERMGIRPYRVTSYRTACREGWAPQPTNEYQKAVWEQERGTKK